MDKKLICTGIVTFNPDLTILAGTLSSLYKQVNLIIIADNGSVNQQKLYDTIKPFPIVKLIANDSNLGIATALNQIMVCAQRDGYDWVLTLDQDSIIEDDYIKRLTQNIDISEAAIYCPKIWDRNNNEFIIDSKVVNGFVTKCITSGSITNIHAWNEVGRYDEILFIDGVDFDFCDRIIKNGYKIKQRENLILNHAIGKTQKRKFLFFKTNIQNHNSMRKYYMARNKIYCDYKRLNRVSLLSIASCIKLLAKTLFFEDNKKEKAISIIRGINDGFKLIKNHFKQ